jgi:hypothetical protein
LFFPNSDPLVGTLEAFGIYAVGFIHCTAHRCCDLWPLW